MTAPVVSQAVAPARPRRYWTDREGILGPIMLLPAVVYIVALVGFPLILAILYSFSSVTVGNQALDFVGWKNFVESWQNPTFQLALVNTIVFTVVSQIIVIVLANVLALVLSTDFPGKRLVRFLILLPWTTPIALGVIGWLWLLDGLYSPIDAVLRMVGLLGPDTMFGPGRNMLWLAQPDTARVSVVLVHVWRTLPLATVILLAGLTAIPQDLRDAANVDGASYLRQLFYIRLPLLLPIMVVAVLYGIVFTFSDMTVVYLLTRGGPPVDSTQVLASWAYFKGIEGGNLAQGAATAVFLFPALVGIAALMLRYARRAETS